MDIDFLSYIKPELLIITPVLSFIGWMIKHKSTAHNGIIPFVLTGFGIFLAALWVFATTEIQTPAHVLMGLFTSLIQGSLCAAASTFSYELGKQWFSLQNKDK